MRYIYILNDNSVYRKTKSCYGQSVMLLLTVYSPFLPLLPYWVCHLQSLSSYNIVCPLMGFVTYKVFPPIILFALSWGLSSFTVALWDYPLAEFVAIFSIGCVANQVYSLIKFVSFHRVCCVKGLSQ